MTKDTCIVTDKNSHQGKEDFIVIKELAVQRLPSTSDKSNKTQHRHSDGDMTNLIAQALQRVNNGDPEACFVLGQLYFEQGNYTEARRWLTEIEESNWEALYQIAIMDYDGLGGHEDQVGGVEKLKRIAWAASSVVPRTLAHAAEYNIGRAYYYGYGVQQNTDEALRWWLLAADDGSSVGSVMAQTSLGYYYSQSDTRDLKKAFFWHTEACANGSLESQGCIGIMYLHGLGVRQNTDTAFHVLKEAAERGNVYAQGNLVFIYYNKKLFTKCTELAARVLAIEDIEKVAEESCCVKEYINKGIAIATFIYGRCLHKGLIVDLDQDDARRHYYKCFQLDPDVCAKMLDLANREVI